MGDTRAGRVDKFRSLWGLPIRAGPCRYAVRFRWAPVVVGVRRAHLPTTRSI